MNKALCLPALQRRLIMVAVTTALGLTSPWVSAHEDQPDTPVGHQAKVLHLAGEHEVILGGGLTIVGQRTSGGVTNESGLTYSVDLAFEGNFGKQGTAFIYLNTSQGTGVDNGAATGPNADNEAGTLDVDEGYSETRIAEAWYEFPLGDMAAVRVGKIDPTGIYDGNDVANDETTQFLGDAFVNNPAIGFPGYTAGINLAVAPSDILSFNVGFFEASSEFKGTLDTAFVIGEAALGYELAGLPGHVRITGWKDDSSDNDGVGLNVDQAVSENITLFARWGSQDDAQDFDSAYSLGGQIAFGSNTVGLGYSMLAATDVGGPDDESQVELYYSHEVSGNVHVTLDVQLASNPSFDSNNDDIMVYGLRAQIDL